MKRILIALMAVCMTLPAIPASAESDAALSLLAINVGKADCLILRCGTSTWMIDTGTAQSWGAVSAALRLNGITALDGVIVTHTDKDHAGGAWALATSSIPVGGWYASAFYCEVTEEKHPVVKAAALRQETVHWLRAGDSLPLDGGTMVVIGPTKCFADKENNNSVVLYVQAAGGSMLLTGDMEQPAEYELLRADAVPQADVLKVGHHGEGDASSNAFIRAVNPRVAVISTNTAEEPDTPDGNVMRALQAVGAQILQTQNASGGVLVTIGGGEIRWSLERWADPPAAVTGVAIAARDAQADTVTLRNDGRADADLSGWYLYSERGNETFVFPDGTVLAAGAALTVGTTSTAGETDILWPDKNVWHNSKEDAACLYDAYGRPMSRLD